MADTLRKNLIKLAAADPKIRQHVLPLLKTAKGPDRWVELTGAGGHTIPREWEEPPLPLRVIQRFAIHTVTLILGRCFGDKGLSEPTDTSLDAVVGATFPPGGEVAYVVSDQGLSSDRSGTRGDKVTKDATKALAYYNKIVKKDPAYQFCKISLYTVKRDQNEDDTSLPENGLKEFPLRPATETEGKAFWDVMASAAGERLDPH